MSRWHFRAIGPLPWKLVSSNGSLAVWSCKYWAVMARDNRRPGNKTLAMDAVRSHFVGGMVSINCRASGSRLSILSSGTALRARPGPRHGNKRTLLKSLDDSMLAVIIPRYLWYITLPLRNPHDI